ncbi:MAG: alpha-amylase family glycosyl hydrolase [Chthoniobacteraceae bacterium]
MPRSMPSPFTKPARERMRIYQLLPRLFGNVKETRKPHGTLAENGCGKFADINDAAIGSLAAMGFTHFWLTGVLRQATSTDYSEVGALADDPALLKGRAGSPYAIRDCFDVCPDYAVDPANRLAEFRALLARLHAAGLGALIDFVPNHVARSHDSIVLPEHTFGARDDRTRFFDPANNFFWLQRDSPGGGPPLRLPPHGQPFAGEMEQGRVTGNNVCHWQPSQHDWFETVKLNYGFDFTTGTHAYPRGGQGAEPIPDTWVKMDRVLTYWQEQGVDGFRCDMAHLVPMEFWTWAVERARVRNPATIFIGEAYDNDPMKVTGGNVMLALLAAGFDAVYDDPAYKKLKSIYDGCGWANDLDDAHGAEPVFQSALRYAENHDEVRLAGDGQWGGVGAEVGRAVSAILFGLSRGPVLLYSGQEVGEPARGAEGFGGDDARTTIFDYWSMPEFTKWVNGHRYDGTRLSAVQRELRDFYARLLRLVGEPAFRDGDFTALNRANIPNEHYGRLPGETASGHWLYACLRGDSASGQRFLVAANLHPTEALHRIRIQLPAGSLPPRTECIERLTSGGTLRIVSAEADSLALESIPPLTPLYFELLSPAQPR